MKPREILNYLNKTLDKRYMSKKIKRISFNNEIMSNKLSVKETTKIKDYWKPYKSIDNLMWHRAYKTIYSTNLDYELEKFIPEDIFYMEIEPSLNSLNLAKAYEDKNNYHNIFEKDKMPRILLRNMNGSFYDEEYNEINSITIQDIFGHEKSKSYIVKPSLDTQKGKNVNKINIENGQLIFNKKKYDDLNILTEVYESDFLIQEAIIQNPVLSSIYKYSLNTIRIVTLRNHGEINCISAVIRFGNEKRIVDNRGIACGINEEGVFNSYATNLNMEKCYCHPYSNANFSGIRIPDFERLKEFVIGMHHKLIYFDLVSWDIAINEDGEFKMIEFNLNKQEINFHQINNGPLFGKYTDAVLERVYK